jgi:hypothetical protein
MAAGDITINEARLSLNNLKPKRMIIDVEGSEITTEYRKYDTDGNKTDLILTDSFSNIGDNEFNNLINDINTGNNIKVSVAAAVKLKRGL